MPRERASPFAQPTERIDDRPRRSASRSGLERLADLPLASLVGAVLALGAALPALWWQPLHEDEVVTLLFAPRSPRAIVQDVFLDRGGAPLHFFIEHATLIWPGEVEGLRGPSVVFFLLALPAAGLVARELASRSEAIAVVLLLALAPLAVGLATFARMYSLFLATLLWSTWAGLVAARRGGWPRWALAGALLGAQVYVHPIAPIYAVVGLATGLLAAERRPLELVREAWPAIAAFVLVAVPYYHYAFGVLSDRYGVERGRPRLTAGTGTSVPESILLALTPGRLVGGIAVGVLALAGLGWLVLRRWRAGAIAGLWVVAPVVFFTFVPVEGARFFTRYVLPVQPLFLLLVASGCVLAGRLAGRRAWVGALLVAALLGWQASEDVTRLRDLRAIGLTRLVAAVEPEASRAVLFSSAGTRALRPPALFDTYVGLELPGLARVEDGKRKELEAFLAGSREPRRGLWILGGPRERVQAAQARLEALASVRVERPSPTVLLVASRGEAGARALVELGLRVREAWPLSGRRDRSVERIIELAREALAGAPGGA